LVVVLLPDEGGEDEGEQTEIRRNDVEEGGTRKACIQVVQINEEEYDDDPRVLLPASASANLTDYMSHHQGKCTLSMQTTDQH